MDYILTAENLRMSLGSQGSLLNFWSLDKTSKSCLEYGSDKVLSDSETINRHFVQDIYCHLRAKHCGNVFPMMVYHRVMISIIELILEQSNKLNRAKLNRGRGSEDWQMC